MAKCHMRNGVVASIQVYLDQGWLYFKARYKKTNLGGYPSNVKGWKSKFFFVSMSGRWYSKGPDVMGHSRSVLIFIIIFALLKLLKS